MVKAAIIGTTLLDTGAQIGAGLFQGGNEFEQVEVPDVVECVKAVLLVEGNGRFFQHRSHHAKKLHQKIFWVFPHG